MDHDEYNKGLVEGAREFARRAHSKQVRKYTGEPYFNHCEEVAGLVRSVGGDDAQIAAAYLHDTVEDTDVSFDDITANFGVDVARLVESLTDVSQLSDGNRAKRKAIDREHSASASARAKTVKLADLISNSKSIVASDPDFAKVYLAEKRLLLPFLKEGNAELWAQAEAILLIAEGQSK